MSGLQIASPWAPYGLSDDPFFQAPLAPSTDATRPISLFVGREEEVKLLGGQVVGSVSSRAIIQGPAGVGKTSFVNRLKVALTGAGVLTHAQPVKVHQAMTPRHFCAEVLKVLLQIRATNQPAALTGRAAAKLAAMKSEEGRDEGAFWRRVGRIVEGEDSLGAGVTVAVLGAQGRRVRIPAEVSDLSLDDEVAQAIAYLSDGGQRRVLIHVNNLENLSRDDAAAAAGLMQDVRDCFLAENSHWLFVGTTGIEQAVFRRTEQVSGIVPFAADLDPLAPEAVAELLRRRYQHLQRGRRLVPPIEPDVAAELYRRYQGDLRNFLRLLSRAVQHHAVTTPGEPLGLPQIVALMAPRYWVDLIKRVGEADAQRLAAVYKGRAHDAEIRVSETAQAAAITQAAASKLVQRLLAAGVIAKSRVEGKSVYYRLRAGDVTVALGLR